MNAVRTITATSAVHAWAADVVRGDVHPYVLFSPEADNDSSTREYYLVIGGYSSENGVMRDCTVYEYTEHLTQFNQVDYITIDTFTTDYMQIALQDYAAYSSFDGYAHLREEVTSNAAFAKMCYCCGVLLGCILISDFVRLVRARLGGGSSG